MAVSPKSLKIRNQLINEIRNGNISPVTDIMVLFGLSRPAILKHIKALIGENKILASGTTKNRVYSLGRVRNQIYSFVIQKDASDEHLIFRNNFAWIIDDLPKNVVDIVFYGFTEMVNNVIDHSEGEVCTIRMVRKEENITIYINDDGEGIFRRITRLCQLSDERQALLELNKGKLTTDPDNHSGQGIFFTSRMFDDFVIESGHHRFDHHCNSEFDHISDEAAMVRQIKGEGTAVGMRISNSSLRTSEEVFAEFSGSEDEDFPFNKTVIPVKLAQYGNEQLVSRSQAKRLLARIENFQYVVFDFYDVDMIGQAFADEIFRVKAKENPGIKFTIVSANADVMKMINRANAG